MNSLSIKSKLSCKAFLISADVKDNFIIKFALLLKIRIFIIIFFSRFLNFIQSFLNLNLYILLSGLDPAWPLYAFCDTDCRITNESAKIVEIVHTNGGFLGNPFAIGDLDFYPNGGGLAQPGCILDIVGSCAHSRSLELYAESILTETGFYGIECTSDKLEKCDGRIETMGGINPISKQAGIYYLETGNKTPFALGNVFDKRNNLWLYRNCKGKYVKFFLLIPTDVTISIRNKCNKTDILK